VSLGLGAGFAAGLCWVAARLIDGGYHTLQFTIIGLLLALWH
jgi:hypothetical protein